MADTGKPDPERAELRTCCGGHRNNRLDNGITKGSRASTKRHIAWLDDEIAPRPCKALGVVPSGCPLPEWDAAILAADLS